MPQWNFFNFFFFFFFFFCNSTYSLYPEHWIMQEPVYVLHLITYNAPLGGALVLLSFLFLFLPCPSLSSPLLSLLSLSTISSISFLPFSGRQHKMTHKGWHVIKLQHSQSIYTYYTPDIRNMWGYIDFAFPFIRLFIRMYVRSFRHRVKVFALKFIRPLILKTLQWISFIFRMMVDIGLKFLSAPSPPRGWPWGQGHGLRIFIKKSKFFVFKFI